jgi:Bacterial antitoxin of ParD toxin-antitoxin type II system and RHH
MILKPLSPDLESFIQSELASGRYTSPEALIEQALILLVQRSQRPSTTQDFPLAGTVLHYDEPFAPAVNPDNWEAPE